MENKNNNLIYGIIIGILLAVVCFLVVYIISTKTTKTTSEPQNNTPKEQTQQTEKINYEIVENNGSYTLKVNGNDTYLDLPTNDLNQVTQLDDILIAKVCTSTCNIYAVDKNSNIIASTNEAANATSITTKGIYITSVKVVGNELYITSQNVMTNQDTESICMDLKNNKEAMFEEKFSYSNGKFGQATTIKTLSAEEFAQQQNLNCNN